jgi:hypothetical protein
MTMSQSRRRLATKSWINMSDENRFGSSVLNTELAPKSTVIMSM